MACEEVCYRSGEGSKRAAQFYSPPARYNNNIKNFATTLFLPAIPVCSTPQVLSTQAETVRLRNSLGNLVASITITLSEIVGVIPHRTCIKRV